MQLGIKSESKEKVHALIKKYDLPLGISLNGRPAVGYSKQNGLNGFDTGGYTGSWDSSGRLAVLHQKEIVLNAHDTENFLAGIEILREITQAIDLQSLSLARMPSIGINSHIASQGGTTLQDITVHAEFPNATDRNEIQEAILSLQNYASQFANRKN